MPDAAGQLWQAVTVLSESVGQLRGAVDKNSSETAQTNAKLEKISAEFAKGLNQISKVEMAIRSQKIVIPDDDAPIPVAIAPRSRTDRYLTLSLLVAILSTLILIAGKLLGVL